MDSNYGVDKRLFNSDLCFHNGVQFNKFFGNLLENFLGSEPLTRLWVEAEMATSLEMLLVLV